MATLSNSFDGGTAGTAITTGNSGGTSGDPFDTVSAAATGTITYSSTVVVGGLSGKFSTGGTAGLVYAYWSTSFGSVTTGTPAARAYFQLPVLPASSTRLVLAANSAGTFCGEWRINSTGKLEQRNGSGVVQQTSSGSVTAGQTFRVETMVKVISGTAGQLECQLYLGANIHGTTPDETLTSAAALNTQADISRWGAGSALPITNFDTYVDDFAASTTGYLGPSVTTVPWAYSYAVRIG